jgi:ribosomal protein L24E
MAPTPSGNGYWLVGSDGSVYAFGDASSFPGKPTLGSDDSISGIVGTGDVHGYWEVSRDGQVFAFGDALSQGSPVSMANPTPPYVAIAR